MVCNSDFEKNTLRSKVCATWQMKKIENLEKGNFGCRIFSWLSKSISCSWSWSISSKIDWGKAGNWLSSYLENRTQFVSIDGYSSYLHFIRCSILVPF